MQKWEYKKTKGLGALLTTVSLVFFTGCGTFKHEMAQVDNLDSSMGLNRSDYKHMSAPKNDGSQPPEPLSVTVDKGAPPIPQLSEILAAPRPPKIGETQLVSLAVTDDVPLKDVLLELAKLADVDIELDSGITGGISFIAKDKPFNEVIDRVANLAGLRYTMKNGVLRVERDTPFIKSYTVDFLNLDRDSESSVSLSTDVLSTSVGSGGGGASGVTTGSTSKVSSKSKGDFWESLQGGLDQIIAYQPAQHVSSSTLQAETETSMLTTPAATPAAAGGAGGGTAAATPPAAAPAPAPAPTPAAAAATTGGTTKKDYTINRQAGIVTFNGTSKQQDLVETLLAKLKSNSSAQVLIEAKILEVDLNQEYSTGINWSDINKKISTGITFNDVGSALATTPTADVASIALTNGGFKALVTLVETFGTTRTLSSPRLHAINNQPSTLTFAVNKVYYQVTATQTPGVVTNGGQAAPTVTVSSTVKTVPIGIIMSIMPSIDMANNEVTLAVHPTLSTTNGPGIPDPAVTYLAAQVGDPSISSVTPEIQVRELDSTVRMKSGQTMVIGGLMQQSGDNSDSGVPFAADVPILGNLFKAVSRKSTNKELVLLIKATIVDTNGSINKVDKDLFHKFSDDPRPVSF